MKLRNILLFTFILLLSGQGFAQKDPKQFNPEIISVSVDTVLPNKRGRVLITYKKITHHAADYFKLYHYVDGNTHDLGYKLKIPVVNEDTTFLYTEANADKHSEAFTMSTVSKDINFNDGVAIAPHSTIFLSYMDFNYCYKYINLKWDPYIGWGNELKEYQLYYKKNNDPYKLKASIDPQKNKFSFNNADFDSKYQFYMVAVHVNGTTKSLSNIIECTTPKQDTMNAEQLFIDSVLYDGDNLNIGFNVDADANILKYVLKKKISNEEFKQIDEIDKNANWRYRFTEFIPLPQSNILYKVVAIDKCEREVGATNEVKIPLLKEKYANNRVRLNWQHAFDASIEQKYDVFLKIDKGDFFKIEQSIFDIQKEYDLTMLSNGKGEEFCFTVEGYSDSGQISKYNSECFKLEPEVKMANAFTPNEDGLNDEIRPQIKYANIVDYEFVVYNQAGAVVFKTKDYAEPWDGRVNSHSVTEGAYVYFFKFSTAGGYSFKETGVINVIYP